MLTTIEPKSGLQQYLAQVYKIPVLTEEEEEFYARRKDEGDINAAKILVSSHLRLVVKIAFKYQNYGLPMMDVISEGNIGLMKAVRDFSLDKGCRLVTYAMWWIRASIQDFILHSWSLVKIGTTTAQKKLFFNLRKLKNRILSYGQKNLSDANVNYIADTLAVNRNEVIAMDRRLSRKDLSLNETVGDGNRQEIMSLIPAKTATPELILANKRENEHRKETLTKALKILNDREMDIIKSRRISDNPATLKDLSVKYGISGERVRQIEESALKRMKKLVENEENGNK